MKHTLAFLFSLIAVCSALETKAQDKKTDSVPAKTYRYGVRVGVDLSKIARSFYEKDYKGLEVVGDYRWTKRYYIDG